MKKSLPSLMFLLLVAACFNPDQDRTDAWSKPGVTEDEVYADFSSCREQANAIIDRDAAIDSGIDDITSSNSYGATATDLEANLDAYDAEKRYRRLLAECMHGRGYALSSDG
jgi:hypothetical protein